MAKVLVSYRHDRDSEQVREQASILPVSCHLPGLPSPDVNSFGNISCRHKAGIAVLNTLSAYEKTWHTYSAHAVDGSNKVCISNGCTSCFNRPHWLTEGEDISYTEPPLGGVCDVH